MQRVNADYPEDSPYWRLRYKLIGDLSMFQLGSDYKLVDLVEGRAALIAIGQVDEDEYDVAVRYRSWLTEETPEGTFRLDDMLVKKIYIAGKTKYGSNDWIDRDESVREIFDSLAPKRVHNTLDPDI